MIATLDTLGTDASTSVDFVKALAEDGAVRTEAVDALKKLAGVSEKELHELIPRRTLDNARKRGTLTSQLAERVAMATEVVHLAHRVFEDAETANRWLQKPNRGLEGERPWALLRTGPGANLVRDVLLRVEHGVYG